MVVNCFHMERDYDLFKTQKKNEFISQMWNWMSGKVNLIPLGSYDNHENGESLKLAYIVAYIWLKP